MKEKKQILLTNDDGIRSPGLLTAAAALENLGFVTVAAPRDQSSGMGRSLPNTSDGIIQPEILNVNGKDWTVYAIGGTPAQAVLHACMEIMPSKPDLVVSGINYGENLGVGITVSGTVGAALEGAAHGIPAIAVSLQTEVKYHLTYSDEIDFSVSAHFVEYFGRIMMEKDLPFDVDVLKIDIPANATIETPWMLTKLCRRSFYEAIPADRRNLNEHGPMGYRATDRWKDADVGSDTHTVRVREMVSVTPLSLDLTSRIDLEAFEAYLRKAG